MDLNQWGWQSSRILEFTERLFTGSQDHRRGAFVESMLQCIAACPPLTSVDSLELSLAKPEEFSDDVECCISFALGHSVKHLGLDFHEQSAWAEKDENDVEEGLPGAAAIDLPDAVYNHTGLESIRLFACRFDVPSFRNFVALKSLSLGYMELDITTIAALLEKCPLLESFSLDRCWSKDRGVYDYPKHPMLENLVVKRCNFPLAMYGVQVPNLRVLKYAGKLGMLEVDVGQAIEEVELDFSQETEFSEEYADVLYTLMSSSLANATKLTICSYMLQVIPTGAEPLGLESPLNMRHLILKTAVHSCDFWGISFFLKSCPCLETLTFEISPLRKLEDYESPFPSEPPRFGTLFECITSALKVVEVKGFRGTTGEMYLLKHFMRYGRLMTNINLYVPSETTARKVVRIQAVQTLRASPRVSEVLQIKVEAY